MYTSTSVSPSSSSSCNTIARQIVSVSDVGVVAMCMTDVAANRVVKAVGDDAPRTRGLLRLVPPRQVTISGLGDVDLMDIVLGSSKPAISICVKMRGLSLACNSVNTCKK